MTEDSLTAARAALAGVKWETSERAPEWDFPGGKSYRVQTQGGLAILCWKGDRGEFFCHGLTFGGGQDVPGGPFSPFSGESAQALLTEQYRPIDAARAKAGDLLIWHGALEGGPIHSAILRAPVLAAGGKLHERLTILESKNGLGPPQDISTLQQVNGKYGPHATVTATGDYYSIWTPILPQVPMKEVERA